MAGKSSHEQAEDRMSGARVPGIEPHPSDRMARHSLLVPHGEALTPCTAWRGTHSSDRMARHSLLGPHGEALTPRTGGQGAVTNAAAALARLPARPASSSLAPRAALLSSRGIP